jgi:stringent starvation protein B
MHSTRPYLLRAFYEWIADNDCTPYVVFDVEQYAINIPERFVEGNQIVLNISMAAVKDLEITNEFVSFDAKFGGVSYNVNAPMRAVVAIYAEENGRGMVFSEEDMAPEYEDDEDSDNAQATYPPAKNKKDNKPKKSSEVKKSHLTVVK